MSSQLTAARSDPREILKAIGVRVKTGTQPQWITDDAIQATIVEFRQNGGRKWSEVNQMLFCSHENWRTACARCYNVLDRLNRGVNFEGSPSMLDEATAAGHDIPVQGEDAAANDYIPYIPTGSVKATHDRKTCPHTNSYRNEAANCDCCPDCNSIRIHGFMNKLTGEKLGGAVSGALADELGENLVTWEEWIQNPGKHNETRGQYERRHAAIDRAFEGNY